MAMAVTQIATGAAALGWMFAEWFGKGKPSVLGIASGAVAGLVAITAEPLTPSALQATLFGMTAGVIVVLSILLLDKIKIDDPVGAISVHGVVGLFGLLIVPLTNPAASLLGQLVGAATIFAWVFISSLIVWSIIKFVIGLRISEEEEYQGADIAECGMEAYPEFIR